MSRFNYPAFVRLPPPRAAPRHQCGKIRRCGRNGHDWDIDVLQCRRCGCWYRARPYGLIAKAFLKGDAP